MNKAGKKVLPRWCQVSLLVQRLLSMVEEEQHRSIGFGKTLQDILHPRLQATGRQGCQRRPNHVQNIFEQQLQSNIWPNNLLVDGRWLAQHDMITGDTLQEPLSHAIQFRGFAAPWGTLHNDHLHKRLPLYGSGERIQPGFPPNEMARLSFR